MDLMAEYKKMHAEDKEWDDDDFNTKIGAIIAGLWTIIDSDKILYYIQMFLKLY